MGPDNTHTITIKNATQKAMGLPVQFVIFVDALSKKFPDVFFIMNDNVRRLKP